MTAAVFFEPASNHPKNPPEYKGAWIAQCLEHDLCAQGKTREMAISRLELTVKINREECSRLGFGDLANVGEAPAYYWTIPDRVTLNVVDCAEEKT